MTLSRTEGACYITAKQNPDQIPAQKNAPEARCQPTSLVISCLALACSTGKSHSSGRLYRSDLDPGSRNRFMWIASCSWFTACWCEEEFMLFNTMMQLFIYSAVFGSHSLKSRQLKGWDPRRLFTWVFFLLKFFYDTVICFFAVCALNLLLNRFSVQSRSKCKGFVNVSQWHAELALHVSLVLLLLLFLPAVFFFFFPAHSKCSSVILNSLHNCDYLLLFLFICAQAMWFLVVLFRIVIIIIIF